MAPDLGSNPTPPAASGEARHTPLPWELHAEGAGYNSVQACQPDSSERGCCPIVESFVLGRTREEAEANAAFIVRAVNNHEALLAALKFCRNVLMANPIEMSEHMAIEKADAAIASAKGGPS